MIRLLIFVVVALVAVALVLEIVKGKKRGNKAKIAKLSAGTLIALLAGWLLWEGLITSYEERGYEAPQFKDGKILPAQVK